MGASQAGLWIRVSAGGQSKVLGFGLMQVTLGSSPASNVVVANQGLEGCHLVVDGAQGVLKARLGNAAARAALGGDALTTDWTALPARSVIQIPMRDGQRLLVELLDGPDAPPTHPGPLHGAPPHESEFAAPEIATPAALKPASKWGVDSADGDATGSPASADHPDGARDRPRSSWIVKHSSAAILIAVIVFVAAIFAALIFNDYLRRRADVRRQTEIRLIREELANARSLLTHGQYTAARQALDDTDALLNGHPELTDELAQSKELRESGGIKYGATGLVLVYDRWLPAALAREWKAARERDDPNIADLTRTAQAALDRDDLPAALTACSDALAIMDAEPVKPHPDAARVTALQTQAKDKLLAREMLAKGMVQYEGKWVTPEEKFRLEQEAKGLALYKGQWLPKDEAFTKSQQDKGLVLYDGKWVTVEEKMKAQGMVLFEGKWMTSAEKTQTESDRAEAARMVREKAEQDERDRRAEADRIEEEKKTAYQMSQTFVKNQLKSPSTAKFQDYTDRHVSVAYSDGWYLVSAVVDSQNALGNSVRKNYLCKLRPKSGGGWEASSIVILD